MASHINADSDRDVRRVLDSIRRIVQALRLYDRQVDKRVGLSGAQLFVLRKLRDGTGISVNELAKRTHTHQSSVSVVAQKLVDRKLVRRSRSKADGRAVELTLTKKGMNLLRSAPASASAQDRLVVALRQLSATKRRCLRVISEELVRKTGSTDRPPALFFEDAPKPKRKERS